MFSTFQMFCILLNKGSSFCLILMWSRNWLSQFCGSPVSSQNNGPLFRLAADIIPLTSSGHPISTIYNIYYLQYLHYLHCLLSTISTQGGTESSSRMPQLPHTAIQILRTAPPPLCRGRGSAALLHDSGTNINSRASNKPSRRFQKHGESPY